jgi:hypothetical protein
MAALAIAARDRLGLGVLVYCPTYLPTVERMRERATVLGLPFVCGMRPGAESNDVPGELRSRYPDLCEAPLPRRRAAGYGRMLQMALARALTVPFGAGVARTGLDQSHYDHPFRARLIRFFGRRGRRRTLATRRRLAAALRFLLAPGRRGRARCPARLSLRRGLGRRTWVHLVTRYLLRRRVATADGLAYWLRLYMTELDAAERVLDVLDPVLGVFPEENVDYNTPIWIAALQHRGARTICFSNELPASSEIAAVCHDDVDKQLTPDRRGLLPWFGRWTHRHQGRDLVRYPPDRLVALELLGLAPRRPWVLNTSRCEAVVVESVFLQRLFAGLGIDQPRGRVQPLGHPALDRLSAAAARRLERRNELQGAFRLDRDRPIVICAVPSDQYATWQPPGLPTYEDLLRFWCDSLERLRSFEALVAPHPSTPPAAIDLMATRGMRILPGSLVDSLPVADLFICSVSSTAKWARALGIPVVNYNVYQFRYLPDERYAYLDGLTGVHTVATTTDYLELLDRLDEPATFAAEARAARSDAADYGTLDGHALDRILDVLARLTGCTRATAS